MTEPIPGLPPQPPAPGRVVLTLGAFDGVHAGHRRLVRRVAALAARRGDRALALTFDPHPRCVVDPEGCPPMLSDASERLGMLRDAGADEAYAIRFDRALSEWSAERFVAALAGLGPLAALVAGPRFAIGRSREGTAEVVRSLARRHGFRYVEVPDLHLGGAPVSSSRIREALSAGRVGAAAVLLARPYELSGVVKPGHGRGDVLGFPTANLDIAPGRCIPGTGIYACRVLLDGVWRPAATSVGTNPTFGPSAPVSIEPHILDLDASLYGRSLRLAFIRRLRGERRFGSVEALRQQIGRDVERTRRLLA